MLNIPTESIGSILLPAVTDGTERKCRHFWIYGAPGLLAPASHGFEIPSAAGQVEVGPLAIERVGMAG